MERIFHFVFLLLLVLTSSVPGYAGAEFSCADITDMPPLECKALVVLYKNTYAPGWVDSVNWMISTTVDDWLGVTVTDGHVTKLSLWENNLSGSLPSELVYLTAVEYLILRNNQLTGGIPPELAI